MAYASVLASQNNARTEAYAAVNSTEELEETVKLFLMLRHEQISYLNDQQIILKERFPDSPSKRAGWQTTYVIPLTNRSMMTSYRIALLPGDGIGPECMDATRIVLDRMAGDIHHDSACIGAAAAIENAVAQLLSDGDVRTPDLGGNASTMDVANAVADAVAAASRVS